MPRKRLLGKLLCKQSGAPVHARSRASRSVEPCAQLLLQARDERQDLREERGQDGLRAVLGHDLVESLEPLVRDAPAEPEALDDIVLDGRGASGSTGR